MRRIAFVAVALLVAAACGGNGTSREGGSTYSGDFETEPGIGPGEISFTLDETGDAIPSITIDPGLTGFQCPAGANEGVSITGGGYTLTVTPGIRIDGDTFSSSGITGEFVSVTEVTGTYDLAEDYDCDHVVSWTATKE